MRRRHRPRHSFILHHRATHTQQLPQGQICQTAYISSEMREDQGRRLPRGWGAMTYVLHHSRSCVSATILMLMKATGPVHHSCPSSNSTAKTARWKRSCPCGAVVIVIVSIIEGFKVRDTKATHGIHWGRKIGNLTGCLPSP